MTMTALEDGFQASFSEEGLSYTLDGSTWVPLAASTNTPAINAGRKIAFKGSKTAANHNGIGMFTTSHKCNLSGNCMSLTHEDSAADIYTCHNYQFCKLFYNCKIVEVSANFLPATTLASHCYQYMFSDCTSLTTAPELPAMTLADSCYGGMFYGCSSLTTAPELPATDLKYYCYGEMFYGCSSLISAPELSATNLYDECYVKMFSCCTSLVTAPQLPATGLYDGCYSEMFRGCTSLTEVPSILPADFIPYSCYAGMFYGCISLVTAPELPAITLTDYCYSTMFYGCSSLTTAPELPANSVPYSCYGSMFTNCTSLVTAPQLPATTLANNCYDKMFYGCSSLVNAPSLPATTLVTWCYNEMFSDCTSLNYIKMLATDISASSCLTNWVSGVASTGIFVKHSNMTSLPTGDSGIPYGWTVIDEGTGSGGTGGGESIALGWSVQSGTWNEESNNSAWDGVQYVCESPGANGSTVIRYAWSGFTEITFNCVYNGENEYDYLTVGKLDTACTRDSYRASLEGNSGTAQSIKYSCDTGTHYVEFCYSKDGSANTPPDNATVYIESVSTSGSLGADITWEVQSGIWNEEYNGSAIDGVQYVCESPGVNGNTVIRCTINSYNYNGAKFVIRSQGESSYDYLNAGEPDSPCTRDSYHTSLSGNQENDVEILYDFEDYGTHYVEFCYSKDSSADTPPDNGVVYLKELLDFGTDL